MYAHPYYYSPKRSQTLDKDDQRQAFDKFLVATANVERKLTRVLPVINHVRHN